MVSPDESSPPVLHASALHYAYGENEPVVRTASEFALRGGELVCLVGPNGAGKSTWLRVLAGLLQPTQGLVTCGNAPIANMAPKDRARRIAFVPQSLDAWPEVTVRTFVVGGRYAHHAFGARLRNAAQSDSIIESALEAMALTNLSHRFLRELSGGERQRALLARAIAQEASIWLCDEPTASLDPGHSLEILDRMRQRTDRGSAILCATHDFQLACQYADRVVLMHDGALIAVGTPGEVMREAVLAPIYGSRFTFGNHADGKPWVLATR